MNTGNNKYFGARYVPIVAGDYNPLLEYEPLVVVLYQGNSYTSKTYVPKGISPVNGLTTQFWACTGNYNAQVEAYKDDVEQFKTDVTNILDAREYDMKEMGMYADGTHATENANLWRAFVEEHKTEAIIMYFPKGNYEWNLPITAYPKHNIKGIGAGGTSLKYSGTGNAFQLPADTTESYEFTYFNTKYSGFTLYGVGEIFGTNAVANGFYFGDETKTKLYNIPMLRFYDIRVSGFKTNIYLEGYGHTLQDVYTGYAINGLSIVHPEQVMCNNVWVEYNTVGVVTNPLSKVTRNYGHKFIFNGGAIQRNKTGMVLLNTYDPVVNTYCELNDVTDFVLGDNVSGNDYVNGVYNADIAYNTDGAYTDNSIKLIASVGGKINVCNYGTAKDNNTSPLVYVNGYSKDFKICLSKEKIHATTPVDVSGDSDKSTIVITDGVPTFYRRTGDKLIQEVMITQGTKALSRYVEYFNNSYHILDKLENEMSYGIKLTDGNNSCFDIVDANNNEMLKFSLVNNVTLSKHLVMKNKKGIVLESPNGSLFIIGVTDAGTLSVTPTGISY